MKRTKGWEKRLAAWLSLTRAMEFEYGVHDCALFAAGAVEALTEVDLAKEFRYKYSTAREGQALLKKAGYKNQFELARRNFPKTLKPKAGDLAILRNSEGQLALGVVQGLMIYVPAKRGWGVVPKDNAIEFFEV